jgi:hypothetical protein
MFPKHVKMIKLLLNTKIWLFHFLLLILTLLGRHYLVIFMLRIKPKPKLEFEHRKLFLQVPGKIIKQDHGC